MNKRLISALGLVFVLVTTLVPAAVAQDAEDGPWNAAVVVACPGPDPCSYVVTAYNADGTEAGSYAPTAALPSHGSTSVGIGSVVGSGPWNGSVVISSDREVVANAVLYVDNSIDREIYSSFSQGATEVYLATVVGRRWSQNHQVAIQNVTTNPLTGRITYYSVDNPTTPAAIFDFSLNGNGSTLVDTSAANPDGPGLTNFSGSAVITATEDIVAAVHGPNYAGNDAIAFEHSLPGNNTIYFPTALGSVYSAQLTTFFAVQNVGDASDTLTATFTAGGTDYITSTVLSPGAKWNLFPSQPAAMQTTPALPTGFSGALQVESDSQPIAGVSNQKALNAPGGCGTSHQMMEYTAQGPAASTSNQVVPFARYSTSSTGWNTYVAAMNVDTSPITVTATFYNEDGTMLAASGGSNPLVYTDLGVGEKTGGPTMWAYAVNNGLSSWNGSIVIEATGMVQVATTVKQANDCNAAGLLGQGFTP